MKYIYPYKAYGIGLFLVGLVICYSIVVLAGIGEWSLFEWSLVLGYFLVVVLIVRYYWHTYKLYVDRYVLVDPDAILQHDHSQEIVIPKERLDVIIVAKHLQRLKIHQVIHIFDMDGTYLFVTNEIVGFEKLKGELERCFPGKVVHTSRLIKGIHPISKGFLYLYK